MKNVAEVLFDVIGEVALIEVSSADLFEQMQLLTRRIAYRRQFESAADSMLHRRVHLAVDAKFLPDSSAHLTMIKGKQVDGFEQNFDRFLPLRTTRRSRSANSLSLSSDDDHDRTIEFI